MPDLDPRCPFGHVVSGFDLFCSTCGQEVRVARSSDSQRSLRSDATANEPVAVRCPRGHSVAGGDEFCTVCGVSVVSQTQSQTRRRISSGNRRLSISTAVSVAVLALLAITGGYWFGTRTEDSTAAASGSTTISPPSTITSSSTSTSVTPTTALPSPTELSPNLPYEPTKCGIDASPKPYPHDANRTYEITATIGLWSEPSTASRQLKLIPVTTFGPGGIGCPDGLGPRVTISCQVPDAQMIGGPFGNDPIWLRTSYDGATGYVTDQWVDTQWDVGTIPTC